MTEKKLKQSAEKIVMPEDLKRRILEQCDNTALNEKDAEEIVFTVEPYRKRNKIIRIVSWAAALAIVVGGLGFTTGLITKEGFSPDSMSDALSNAPFGDISNESIDLHSEKYWTKFFNDEIPEDVTKQIAEFLNNMEYVEKVDYYYPSYDENPDRPCNAYTVTFADRRKPSGFYQGLYIIEDDTMIYSASEEENIYYQIDYKAFDELVTSLLPFIAPFGNVYQHDFTVSIDMEEDFRTPTPEQKRLLAELFNSVRNWEEIPDYDRNITEICHEITYTDTNEKLYICKNNMLIHEKSDGSMKAYSIDFEEIDKYIRWIMRNETPFGYVRNNFPDLYINGNLVKIDEELFSKIDNFFYTIDWKPLEHYNYLNMDVIHKLVLTNGTTIYISSDNVVIYEQADGTQTAYYVDFKSIDLIMREISPESYEVEDVQKVGVPEVAVYTFSGFRDTLAQKELTEQDIQEMIGFVEDMCKEDYEEFVDTAGHIPNYDFISFTKQTADTTYIYNVNLIQGYVQKIDAESSAMANIRYFKADRSDIITLLRSLMKDDETICPPMPSLWKTGEYTCTSEYFNGILSEERAIALTGAFYGWDWSDCTEIGFNVSLDIALEEKFRFTSNEHNIIVYSDGTVIYDDKMYSNIDKDSDNLNVILRELLMSFSDEDMLNAYRNPQ